MKNKLKELYLNDRFKGRSRNELPKSWYQFNLGCYCPEMLSNYMNWNLAELKNEWSYLLKKDKQGIKVAVSDTIRLLKNEK